MKNFFIFISLCFLASCSEDSKTHLCSDPAGSEDLVIYRCDNNDSLRNNLAECYYCFGKAKINGTDTTCFFNKCYKLYADSPSANWIIWSWHFAGNCSDGTIVDVGTVTCLGDVINKPQSGYVYQLTPQINHGYVVYFPDDSTYGRFFVQGITKNIAGRDTSVNITRQYPF